MSSVEIDEFPALYFEELVLHEELPPCEGKEHHLGTLGHVPGTAAEFLVVAPYICEHSWRQARFCEGRTAYWRGVKARHVRLICKKCDARGTCADIQIYPL